MSVSSGDDQASAMLEPDGAHVQGLCSPKLYSTFPKRMLQGIGIVSKEA
jgi:hypothetical protein